ncbi:MAG: sulfite exporter TauE/SafE family protein [Deltaproteobacteria bacterium]|nr:sulfite exporter TauE/SafE family protein [Deltaproteobacteria bacterium]
MSEILHLSTTAFAVVFAAVLVGAIIQGAIGFGLNLVVVPVVAILEPAALPASMIVMAVPMTLGSALRERGHIDRSGIGWTTLGRLPGVALGAWIVDRLDPDALASVIGALVVIAAGMSVLSPPIRLRPGSACLAGLASGVMGTASSIGGPPIALLYQHQPGPVLRSTLGAIFAIGVAMSLGALLLAGQVARWQALLGVALMPAIGLGLWLSRFLHAWLDRGWLRPCLLIFAVCSGMTVLLRGLL